MTHQELTQLPDEESLRVLNKIKEETGAVPPEFVHIYDMLDKSEGFKKSKHEWRDLYPDFRLISDTMDNFRTNAILVEFRKGIPPPSILADAIRVYKKCISFKEKLTKTIQKNLSFSHETPVMFYARVRYCIDREKVHSFLNQYQKWYGELHPLWDKVYYEANDFFNNSGYDRLGWTFYIQHPDHLKRKADEIRRLHDKLVYLLDAGKSLVEKLDTDISSEYDISGFEMSLYERELEISRAFDECNLPDEAYCYVYTLECDLFVFYVGIASDPQERLEQHIRGAFNDESHLFKSKFIQKFGSSAQFVGDSERKDCSPALPC